MQDELDAAAPPVPISLIAVNHMDASVTPDFWASAMTGRDLPWVQDTPAQNVWATWLQPPWPVVQNWDVVVLDRCNQIYTVFPVSQHPLEVPENYAALKSLLLAASAASAP